MKMNLRRWLRGGGFLAGGRTRAALLLRGHG
jgi:hypothetical protein